MGQYGSLYIYRTTLHIYMYSSPPHSTQVLNICNRDKSGEVIIHQVRHKAISGVLMTYPDLPKSHMFNSQMLFGGLSPHSLYVYSISPHNLYM